MTRQRLQARRARADAELARPFLNGGVWCVTERIGRHTWHYRPAPPPEPAAATVPAPREAIVAGPAPVRLALAARDGERVA